MTHLTSTHLNALALISRRPCYRTEIPFWTLRQLLDGKLVAEDPQGIVSLTEYGEQVVGVRHD